MTVATHYLQPVTKSEGKAFQHLASIEQTFLNTVSFLKLTRMILFVFDSSNEHWKAH